MAASKNSNELEPGTLISPYGGKLVDLFAPPEAIDDLIAYANRLPSIQLTERAVCDLEMLATGAFSPLDRFMRQEDYESVLETLRLPTGHLFPIPITLSVDSDVAIRLDRDIALRDNKNDLLAVMTVDEAYEWDLEKTARSVFRTDDLRHPLVAEMHRWGKINISGPLKLIKLPARYDFRELRLTPSQTRTSLAALGRKNVIAFQTRNPLHLAHEQTTKRAIHARDVLSLLHPSLAMTKP